MTKTNFPIIEHPPDEQRRPLVISVPHSGRTIPQAERRWYAVDPDKLEWEGDLYVDELYQGAHALGATVIRSPFNRFLIDLNRLPDDFSPLSVTGGRIRRNPGYYGHRGLIWAVTTHGQPIYKTPLPRAVVQRRIEQYYRPYHKALRTYLQSLRDEFGYAILLDAHSMPSQSTKSVFRTPKPRADIVPGDLMGLSCSRWVIDAIIDYWRSTGRSVKRNHPYRGGAITRRHHLPSQQIHAIQIELNRALYMDEHMRTKSDGFNRLRNECLNFVAQCTRIKPPSMQSSAAE